MFHGIPLAAARHRRGSLCYTCHPAILPRGE